MIDWSQVPHLACASKTAYESRRQAAQAASSGKGGLSLRPYRCQCGMWHLSGLRQSDRNTPHRIARARA